MNATTKTILISVAAIVIASILITVITSYLPMEKIMKKVAAEEEVIEQECNCPQ